MANTRKDDIALEMYELYQSGYSLALIGEAYDVTRQSVYDMFKTRRYKLRPKLKPKPFIVFNGSKYTMRNTGYFGKTIGDRTLLHRDMWEFHNGVIPIGWDVHHKDGDREHNEINNFECLPKSDHTRLHSHGQNQHTKKKKTKYVTA